MPRYFRLLSMGNDQDKRLAFLDTEPIELAEHGYRLAIGESMADLYPAVVRMAMQPESPGLKLSSLLGNLMGYLIVDTPMKRVLADAVGPDSSVEFFPFQLINHKGRLHSTNYVIVNPVGHVDCLDHGASQITYAPSDPGVCLSVERYVLDGTRLDPSRRLFRLASTPREYFIDEGIAAHLQSIGASNVFLDEVDVR